MSLLDTTMESLRRLLDQILSIQLTDLTRQLLESPTGRGSVTALAILGIAYVANKTLGGRTASSSKWDWEREIVLITGGASGLGELTTRKLAARGVRVVAVDLRPPPTPLPTGARFYKLDVTSPAAIRDVAQRLRADMGGDPTVLVNNAGVGTGKTVLEETDAEIRRTFEVNAIAHFFMVREFLPSMVKKDHGHVVAVASTASFITLAGNVDYAASKAAALAFHEGLGQELRWRYNAGNVCTSIIHPSFVRTPMLEVDDANDSIKRMLLDPDDVAEAMVKHIMGGRSGQVFLPAHLSWLSALRGFPSFFQEKVRGSMAHVLQRPPAA